MALYVGLLAAIFVGAVVQSSIGFGFAFFAAPVAVAACEPERAVMILLLAGLSVNALVLFGEGRQPVVSMRPIAIVAIAAMPGMAFGTFLVGVVSTQVLQVVVGTMILVATALQLAEPDLQGSHLSSHRHLLGAGLTAGVLTTATSLNGPPVVVGLTSLGWRGEALRDGISAALLALGVSGAAVLSLTRGGVAALPQPWLLGACVPVVAVGHRVGTFVFRRFDQETHRIVVLSGSALAGAASIALGLL